MERVPVRQLPLHYTEMHAAKDRGLHLARRFLYESQARRGARETNRAVAELLEEIIVEHMNASSHADNPEFENQRLLRAPAERFLGILSRDSGQRSRQTHVPVRARLKRRRPHAR
jgi:hypothetical protein